MVCAQASTSSGCGCPYALEFKHKGDGTVTVTQTEAHQFHDPSDVASLAKLKMHPALQSMGLVLLRCGVKPLQVCNELNAAALEDGVLGSSGSGVFKAANARGSITLDQVKALAKQVRRAQGLNVTSDSSALAAAVAAYREQGVVPFYQPYRAATKEAGEHPLIIILQTPWQARMLDQFGRTLAFADSTYGTNWAGYPLYATTVRSAGMASTNTPRCMVQIAVWWPCWGETRGHSAAVATLLTLLLACLSSLAGARRRGPWRACRLHDLQLRHSGGGGEVFQDAARRGEWQPQGLRLARTKCCSSLRHGHWIR